jgi:ribonuclease P protein component
MTLVVLPNSSPVSRLGISATRKLGNAVQRNVAKRRIREIFRTHVTAPSADIVVIPRPGLFSASFEDLVADYCAILERQTRGPSRGSRQRSRD